MGITGDTYTLFKREMLIFKSNLRTNIIRSILFPVILILFFGNLGNSIKGVQIAVVNNANNPQSIAFINSLESTNAFSVQGITTMTNGIEGLRDGSLAMLVVINPTFPHSSSGAPGVYIYYSESSFTELSSMSIIESAAEKFGASAEQVQSTVQPQSFGASAAFGGKSSYKDFIVAGIVIMVAAFGAIFGGGITSIMDRQLGNLKAFLITPINKLSILLSKILSGTVQAEIYGLLALVIGLLDGAGVAMGAIGYLWIIVIAALISLGFSGATTLLASRIKRVEVYAIFANMISLPLWFLSGAFFPATNFPTWLQIMSVYDPMTYAVQGIRYVMILGYYPVSAMMVDIGVLLLFAGVMLALSLMLFKTTIE